MTDKPHAETGADDRAHGTHGKGDSREQRVDPATPEPGKDRKGALTSLEAATSELSDAGWGSAAAGDSSVDKRPPKKKKED